MPRQVMPQLGPSILTESFSTWDGNGQNSVFALAVDGTAVYVGGLFLSIGGELRNNLAAFDAVTGKATSWNSNVTGDEAEILSLAIGENKLYLGGTSCAERQRFGCASRRVGRQ